MNRRIEILRNITAELLNYLLVCSGAYIVIADFAKMEPPVGTLILLAAIPLFFYGLRERCDKLWLFLVLHVLPPLLLLFCYKESAVLKVVFAAIILLYVFLSIGKRIHSTGRGMEAAAPPAAAGVYFALYLLDGAQGGGENGTLLLQLLICFAAGYFIYYYLRQFLSYVDINARTTENIPVKNVFYSSAGLAAGFTAVAFCLITVCANRSLIERISAALKSLIRKVLSLIQLKPSEVNIEPDLTPKQGGGGFPGLGEEVELSLFMQIMDVVLTLATFALILFVLVSGVIALSRIIKESFSRKGYKQKFVETEVADKVERISRKEERAGERKQSLTERWKQVTSPEERIRRIYKKAVLKSVPSWEGEKREELLFGATARECCLELFGGSMEEAREFIGLYEKARYGRAMCRQTDVGRMKELAEKLHRSR